MCQSNNYSCRLPNVEVTITVCNWIVVVIIVPKTSTVCIDYIPFKGSHKQGRHRSDVLTTKIIYYIKNEKPYSSSILFPWPCISDSQTQASFLGRHNGYCFPLKAIETSLTHICTKHLNACIFECNCSPKTSTHLVPVSDPASALPEALTLWLDLHPSVTCILCLNH